MATAENRQLDGKVSSKIDDLHEFSNIFASEFNSSDLHDRVLCFQFIEDVEFETNVDCEDDVESERGSVLSGPIYTTEDHAQIDKKDNSWNEGTKDDEKEETVEEIVENNNAEKTSEPKEDEKKPQEEQKQQYQAEEREGTIECQDKAAENTHEDTESKRSETANQTDDENISTANKLFVHSQWLAVQSPYFKALFYSGMKETYSKEVVMKIYEHELQAHLTLIEAMYKVDVLNDKDYRLIVQVLVFAHKYDVRHVINKCKYNLLSTTPNLEMCEYTLRGIAHLSDMAEIYDMLEKFLVKEFTPIGKTWTMNKFTELSEAALRFLLGSDSLATQSENTIFVALMKWVRSNIPSNARDKCDLLDVVRFELMSVDFLYDVVQRRIGASKMPGFNKYLLKGLAYHGFSQIRREQLEPKPKKRPVLPQYDDPTFSWVIDDELQKKLSKFPGVPVLSNKFWYQGYPMKLQLSYAEDFSKCSFFLQILNMAGEACLYVSYRAKSSLFASWSVQSAKNLYTAGQRHAWGYRSLERNQAETGKGYTIDVWVKIV